MAEWRARIELTPNEYESLVRYIYDKYGGYSMPSNTADIFNTWQYQYWSEAGKPGLKERLADVQPLTPEEEEERFLQWQSQLGQTQGTAPTKWPIEPMSDYQREMMELNWAQQGLSAEQFAWQKQQAGMPGEVQPSPEALFELARKYLLGQPMGPSDWITQYQIQHMENPYKGPTYKERKEKEYKEWAQANPEHTPISAVMKKRGTGQWISPKLATEAGLEGRVTTEGGYGKAGGPMSEAFPMHRISGRTERREPQEYPNAPAFLTKFVPGLTAGEEISKEKMRTPSGQQWAKTPWTQREMLSGYGEWAGQPLIERLEHMQRMQPKTPSGTARKRWTPAKQWA